MEKILTDANEWFAANKLKLNENKTQQLIISSKPKTHQTVKFLGMHLNSAVTWDDHIQKTCNKLASAVYSVRRVKSISTFEAAKMAYHANFHSRATYGIFLWGASTSEVNKIFNLQKKVVRILGDLKHRDSCRKVFKELKILTIPSSYILSCLVYVHSHLSEFNKNNLWHQYETRNAESLMVPYHRLKRCQQDVDY